MKKSISVQKIFTEYPMYERFAKVKEAGFEYAEFSSWVDKDMDRVKDICGELGLKIASFSGDKDYSLVISEERQGFLDYLGESLEAAKKLDVKHLVIHSNGINEFGKVMTTGEDRSDTAKITAALVTLQKAAPMAEAAGVTLVLEGVNNISMKGMYMTTATQTGELVKAVNSPFVKILYDTWHMQQMEGNMMTMLNRYKDVLGYLHIGDVPERHEPGTGEINWSRFKAEIEKIGYDGIWGFELDPADGSEKCAEIIRKF